MFQALNCTFILDFVLFTFFFFLLLLLLVEYSAVFCIDVIFPLFLSFFSIGGRVDMFNVSQEHSNAGIFIKHVLGDSPAGRNGTLKKGDRILEVWINH